MPKLSSIRLAGMTFSSEGSDLLSATQKFSEDLSSYTQEVQPLVQSLAQVALNAYNVAMLS